MKCVCVVWALCGIFCWKFSDNFDIMNMNITKPIVYHIECTIANPNSIVDSLDVQFTFLRAGRFTVMAFLAQQIDKM